MTPARQQPGFSWALCAIATTAVVVRWFFCLVAYPRFFQDWSLVGRTYFFDHYLPFAQNLIAGHGYRIVPDGPWVLDRPPGYMAVMLPVAAAGTHGLLVMHLLHGLLGGLSAWLSGRLARRVGAGEGGSLVAGAVVAFWPYLIWESRISVPENLLVALVPAVVLALARWRDDGRIASAALLGALAGWTILCHGLYQVLLPVLMVAMLSVGGSWRKRITGAAAFVLACAVLLVPWTMHTTRAAGRWVGVATGFGHHYLKGLATFARLKEPGRYFNDVEGKLWKEIHAIVVREGFNTSDDTLIRSDPAINARLDALAIADLRARPAAALLRTAVRAPLFWIQQQSVRRAALNAVLLFPIFVLALRGLRRHVKAMQWVMAAVVLAVNLAAAAVFIEARPMRYALPLMPLLAVLAAHGLRAGASPRTAAAEQTNRAVAPGASTG